MHFFLLFKCKLANPCAANTLCHNRSPGYWCPPCPEGYAGKEVHGMGLYFARNNKQVWEMSSFLGTSYVLL